MSLASNIMKWAHGIRARAFRSSRISGHVDCLANGSVRGWVHDPSRPRDVLRVDVCADGERIASFRADQIRDDLVALFGGEGRHGFSGNYDLDAWRGRGRMLSVRIADRPDIVLGSAIGPVPQLVGFPPEKWSCLMHGVTEEQPHS